MGMCKNCGEVFKTEDMHQGFCQNCFGTESYKKEIELINNGTREREAIIASRKSWSFVLYISFSISLFLIFYEIYQLLTFSLMFVVFSVASIIGKTLDLNKDKVAEFSRKVNHLLGNLVKFLFIALISIGYLANFHAVYSHWHYNLSIGRLAEFIGIFIPPLGSITGWIHLL